MLTTWVQISENKNTCKVTFQAGNAETTSLAPSTAALMLPMPPGKLCSNSTWESPKIFMVVVQPPVFEIGPHASFVPIHPDPLAALFETRTKEESDDESVVSPTTILVGAEVSHFFPSTISEYCPELVTGTTMRSAFALLPNAMRTTAYRKIFMFCWRRRRFTINSLCATSYYYQELPECITSKGTF